MVLPFVDDEGQIVNDVPPQEEPRIWPEGFVVTEDLGEEEIEEEEE